MMINTINTVYTQKRNTYKNETEKKYKSTRIERKRRYGKGTE